MRPPSPLCVCVSVCLCVCVPVCLCACVSVCLCVRVLCTGIVRLRADSYYMLSLSSTNHDCRDYLKGSLMLLRRPEAMLWRDYSIEFRAWSEYLYFGFVFRYQVGVCVCVCVCVCLRVPNPRFPHRGEARMCKRRANQCSACVIFAASCSFRMSVTMSATSRTSTTTTSGWPAASVGIPASRS
jgi:hypothetical protein